MEFENFTLKFLQYFSIFLFLALISSFLFKNKKPLIVVITNFILLVFVHVFVISQKAFIFENFPNYAYGMLILLVLMYIVFFRDLYSYINAIKSGKNSIK